MSLTRDTIIAFLEAHPRPICPTCLSRTLRLPYDRILDAWTDIDRRRDLPVQTGVCAVCRTQSADVIHPRR